MSWEKRSSQPEILDEEGIGLDRIRASLRFMCWINKFLGGTNAVLDYFRQNAREDEFSVLDLGTGSGDIPFALARWAKEHGKRVEITAIDSNPVCIEFARGRFNHPCIHFMPRSAFDIDDLGPFDYMTASMFFHHLPDESIVDLMQKMFQSTRRGFVINDLYRHPVAYWGVAALSALTLNPVVFHDARLSVMRGFREADAMNYRDWSGIDGLRIEQKLGFRLVMSYRHAIPSHE